MAMALLAVIVILAAVLGPVLSLRGRASGGLDWRQISTPRGDKLPDFSFAGYHASNKSLPVIGATAPQTTVQPSTGGSDQAQQIQDALNQTATAGGGVVLLAEGNFTIASGLVVPRSVTLRGSGPGKTRVVSTVKEPSDPIITMGDAADVASAPDELARAEITNSYVPVGTSTLNVGNASGFAAGQAVMVNRAVTAEWVRANGMADLVRDGKDQTWLEVGKLVQQPNTISSVSSNTITLSAPLTDSLDSRYMSAYIIAYTLPPTAAEVGIEQLSLSLATSCSGSSINSDVCNGPAIRFSSWTVDSWARNLSLTNFNNFVDVAYNASQITIQGVSMYRDADVTGTALPAGITITGSRVLVQDCGHYGSAEARSFTVMTGSLTPGPNVVRRHVTQSTLQTIYPHQRWAHGLLVEDTNVPVLFVNRGIKGTGHGWSINAGVGWNLRGQASFGSPPLGVNWCVGCSGKTSGNGTYINAKAAVSPESLFDVQLQNRGL